MWHAEECLQMMRFVSILRVRFGFKACEVRKVTFMLRRKEDRVRAQRRPSGGTDGIGDGGNEDKWAFDRTQYGGEVLHYSC